jgi:hypothetical protein
MAKTSPKTWGNKPKLAAPESKELAHKVDALVNKKRAATARADKRRLSIDIPSELHTRIKVQCAQAKRDMTEAIVQLLDASF